MILRSRCAAPLGLLAIGLMLGANIAVGSGGAALPPVSVVQVPLDLDLQPLFAAAENL